MRKLNFKKLNLKKLDYQRPINWVKNNRKKSEIILIAAIVWALTGKVMYDQRDKVSEIIAKNTQSVKESFGWTPNYDNSVKAVTNHDRAIDSTLCEPFVGFNEDECNPSVTSGGSIDDECRESPNDFTGIYDIPKPPVTKKPEAEVTPTPKKSYTPPTKKQPSQPATGKQPYQPIIPDSNRVDTSYVTPVVPVVPVTPVTPKKEGKSRLERALEYDHPCSPTGKCDDGGNIQ